MDMQQNQQLQRTPNAGESSASRPDDASSSQQPSVLFREIHKAAWLKKIPVAERRIGAFPKKGERVWVVFCVHDDTEAFLELYSDQKVALMHKPDWCVLLNNCLHVSPTICPQEDEYEFVVTLSSDVVRLMAPTWELMIEWVDAIRSKLREMKILSPKENVYSKMPEARLPLAPTRDPTSPLPPPPAGPSAVVPGVEPVQSSDSSDSSSSTSSVDASSSSESSSEIPGSLVMPETVYDNSMTVTLSGLSSLYVTQSEPPVYARHRPQLGRASSVPGPSAASTVPASTSGSENVTVIEVSDRPAESSGEVFSFDVVATGEGDAGDREPEELYFTPPATPARPLHYECVFPSQPGADGEARAQPRGPAPPESNGDSRGRPPEPSRRRQSLPSPEGARGRARTESDRRLQPAPHPYRQVQQAVPGPGAELASSGRLTLREQQVLQLRREMLHPGGVRLQLRRKDCTGSIALVDAFGAVWVAGWKQRERPMLYNALHIGDQLLSAAGIPVQSAADAQKLIRGATSLYVEFIVRRIPFGRVLAIRREAEGQSLGIVQESGTAEIRDVVPGGLAARHGLPARARTCDGLSLTSWVLTEVNGRPLNLFFKDGEARDRLNAVGQEVSVLVQPCDLVVRLRKQLKAVRGYKDYIVQ
ncbi:uncharacterized protein LOC134536136 isoform X2 [Bacillus rossius redtenbacheri]|uniref:uncharacterized protein LOC134536136 isoform X2 n=1 Tax=Bacillus rossius redtenbacheri TaxID=93214 RepID=UPI002FDE4300